MIIAAALDKAILAAGVPREAFDGVSVGFVAKGEQLDGPADPTDRARWRIAFTEAATDEDRAAAQAVLDAFDPATVREPVMRAFGDALERLTPDEYAALHAAKAQNLTLARFYDRAVSQGTIDMAADDTRAALAMVVQAGLFTEARLAELFAPEA